MLWAAEEAQKEFAMVRLEELTVPDGLSGAVDSARRGLDALDRNSVGDAATSAARTILPDRWFRPKPRRWPFVVAALLLLATVASVLLLRAPLMTSRVTGKLSDGPSAGGPEPDASHVVSGPVGSASLRDPASTDHEGADLSRLLEIDVDPENGQPSRTATH